MTASRGSLCRRHRAGTSVGLQAVHRDDLVPLPHLDGEGLCPFGHHLVRAGIWGRQWLLLAANTHVYVLCPGQVSWLGICSHCIRCLPRGWWRHVDMWRICWPPCCAVAQLPHTWLTCQWQSTGTRCRPKKQVKNPPSPRRVVDPKWFVSDPTFKEVSAPTPDPVSIRQRWSPPRKSCAVTILMF